MTVLVLVVFNNDGCIAPRMAFIARVRAEVESVRECGRESDREAIVPCSVCSSSSHHGARAQL